MLNPRGAVYSVEWRARRPAHARQLERRATIAKEIDNMERDGGTITTDRLRV